MSKHACPWVHLCRVFWILQAEKTIFSTFVLLSTCPSQVHRMMLTHIQALSCTHEKEIDLIQQPSVGTSQGPFSFSYSLLVSSHSIWVPGEHFTILKGIPVPKRIAASLSRSS